MSLTLPSNMPVPAGILFGAECNLTAAVLAEMLARGLPVRFIVLSGPPDMKSPLLTARPARTLPVLTELSGTQTVAQIAAAEQLPIYRVGNLQSDESRSLLTLSQADYLISACFPRRIPPSIVTALPHPALNLHPSRLPELRGPDPLFWTFHEGAGRGGLTLHELSNTLDAGDIVAQQSFDIPDGTTERDLEGRLARSGVAMLAEVLAAVASDSYTARGQDHSMATYAPFPTENDYVVDRSWSARRAFNFVRGVVGRGSPIKVETSGQLTRVVSVAGYGKQPEVPDDHRLIEMANGYLVARLKGLPD